MTCLVISYSANCFLLLHVFSFVPLSYLRQSYVTLYHFQLASTFLPEQLRLTQLGIGICKLSLVFQSTAVLLLTLLETSAVWYPAHPPRKVTRQYFTSDFPSLIKIPSRSHSATYVVLWTAVVLCSFGFFHSGEITLPSAKAFDPQHLA